MEIGHYFLALYLALFGVEVSPAEYAVWTFWEMTTGECWFLYALVRQRVHM